MVYWELGDYVKALEHHRKALSIRLQVLGAKHAEVARVLRLIAEAHWGMGALDQAQEKLEKSVAIYEKKSGAAYEETVAAYLDLADVLAERRDNAAAAMYHKAWTNGHQTCEKGTALACSVSAVARCAAGQCDTQAAADAHKAISLAPSSADSQEALAFVLLTQGKKDEARRLYCKLPQFGTLNHLAARQRQARLCPTGK